MYSYTQIMMMGRHHHSSALEFENPGGTRWHPTQKKQRVLEAGKKGPIRRILKQT